MLKMSKIAVLITIYICLFGCENRDKNQMVERYYKSSMAIRDKYDELSITIVRALRDNVAVHYALFELEDEKWGFELDNCSTSEDIKNLFGVEINGEPPMLDLETIQEYGFDQDGFSISDVVISCDQDKQNIPMDNSLYIDIESRHSYLEYRDNTYYSIPDECDGVERALQLEKRARNYGYEILKTTPSEAQTIKLVGCVDPSKNTENQGAANQVQASLELTKIENYQFGHYNVAPPSMPENHLEQLYFLISRTGVDRQNDIYLPIYKVNHKLVYEYDCLDVDPTDLNNKHFCDQDLSQLIAEEFGATIVKDMSAYEAYELIEQGKLFEYPLLDICIGTCNKEDFDSPSHFTLNYAKTAKNFEQNSVQNTLLSPIRSGARGEIMNSWNYASDKTLLFNGCDSIANSLGLSRVAGQVTSWNDWAENFYNDNVEKPSQSAEVAMTCQSKSCYRKVFNERDLRSVFEDADQCRDAEEIFVQLENSFEIKNGTFKLESGGTPKKVTIKGKDGVSLRFEKGTDNCAGTYNFYAAALAVCHNIDLTLDNVDIFVESSLSSSPGAAVEIGSAKVNLINSTIGEEQQPFEVDVYAVQSTLNIIDSTLHAKKSAMMLFDSNAVVSSTDGTEISSFNVLGDAKYEAIMADNSHVYLKRLDVNSATPIGAKSSRIRARLVRLNSQSGKHAFLVKPPTYGGSSDIRLDFASIGYYQVLANIFDPDGHIELFMPFELDYGQIRNEGSLGSIDL